MKLMNVLRGSAAALTLASLTALASSAVADCSDPEETAGPQAGPFNPWNTVSTCSLGGGDESGEVFGVFDIDNSLSVELFDARARNAKGTGYDAEFSNLSAVCTVFDSSPNDGARVEACPGGEFHSIEVSE